MLQLVLVISGRWPGSSLGKSASAKHPRQNSTTHIDMVFGKQNATLVGQLRVAESKKPTVADRNPMLFLLVSYWLLLVTSCY